MLTCIYQFLSVSLKTRCYDVAQICNEYQSMVLLFVNSVIKRVHRGMIRFICKPILFCRKIS